MKKVKGKIHYRTASTLDAFIKDKKTLDKTCPSQQYSALFVMSLLQKCTMKKAY